MKLPITSAATINTLRDKLMSRSYPIKTSYALIRIFEASVSEAKVYAELLNNIIEKYAERDEAGNVIYEGDNVQLRKDSLTEASREFNDLMRIEVDMPDVKLDIESFGDIELTPDELNLLMPFFG